VQCFPFKDTPTVTWINIDGLHQVDIIEKLGKHFSLHPLILEDIVSTEQRPKMEDFENYIFVITAVRLILGNIMYHIDINRNTKIFSFIDLKRNCDFQPCNFNYINILERGESPLIKKACRIFLRDVYDHTIQVIDTVEKYRDMVSGMHDTYLSSISNRMNEVMKVLTIIATIFIPLTFIAGIYGMNFEFMPELKWRGAYFGVWGIIVLVAVLMVIFFRRKKWL